MCLYPKLIDNPKYRANKKNGGNIPPIRDSRVKKVPIGCGDCMECRKQKARGWQVRLLEDLKEHKNGKFITLTFSGEALLKLRDYVNRDKEKPYEGYELDNMTCIAAVRLFLERWRKEYKKSLRHWFVTELGHSGTEHVHIHGIVWTDQDIKNVVRHWQYGHVWIGEQKNGKVINYVNERTVNYIVKYVHKVDEKHRYYKSMILTSAGIGRCYTKGHDWKKNKYKGKATDTTYRSRQGFKIAMPNYWRNKIYTEHERELLWLHMLDKMERWVCGERVSIKDDDKEYYRLVEYYRVKNVKLGYGGLKTWEQEQYERERRIIKQRERYRELDIKRAAGKTA